MFSLCSFGRKEEALELGMPKPDTLSGLQTSNSCIFNKTVPKNRTRCPVFNIGAVERPFKAAMPAFVPAFRKLT